jgi:fibronectin-binding autotransporter adhesin
MSSFYAPCTAKVTRSVSFCLVVLAAISLAAPPGSARAAISLDGDFSPSDPSAWNASTPGYVGNTAAGTLTIDGDSDLTIYSGYVGYGSSATGVVNVSGSGSTWTNLYGLYVGNLGSGTLSISAAGRVSCGGIGSTCVGYGPGSSGMVTVDGSGSYFSNYSLCVGNLGSGTLSIANGGVVRNAQFCFDYIGCGPGSSGLVNVSGTGSGWLVYGGLYVGNSGSGTLSIDNGGTVTVVGGTTTGPTYVGYGAGSTGLISFGPGGGTLTTQSLFASFDQLYGNGTISTRGLVSDVDLKFDSSHTLVQSFPVEQSGGTVTVDLDMSSSSTNGCLGAGWRSAGSLTIQDSRSVTSATGYIGYGSGATGQATVSGTNSHWTIRSSLYVGYLGNGTLTIADKAGVSVGTGSTYVGWDAGSSGLINFGPGGGILMTRSLFASLSQLVGTGTITTAGLVSDGDLRFDSSHPLSQTFLHEQSGGTVTLRLTMSSGTSGSGSLGAGWRSAGSLTIQNGLTVGSSNGYLGYARGASGVATVSGSNSTWLTGGPLYIGYHGSGALSLVGGGKVVNQTAGAYIGYDSDASGTVTVSGTGSIWAGSNCFIGWLGHGSLSILNGGSMTSGGTASIAYAPNSTGEVSIDGAGSVWQHVGGFLVGGIETTTGGLIGGSGGHATLSITNGGKLLSNNNDYGYIGVGTGATGVATVDGAGSAWYNGYFWVGYHGGTGALSITNGGSFYTLGASIGREAGSLGAMTISGPGSKWDMSNGIAVLVGCYGGTGSLSIRNGGNVISNQMGYGFSGIGVFDGSTGIAIVDGPGSTWTNTNTGVEVGYAGSSGTGTLSITGGGKVPAMYATVTNTSLLGIDVGRGSSLSVSLIANDGTVRILAGAGVPVDNSVTYSPIAAGTWSGTGTYQPVGGTWDADNHLFTASSVTPGMSGSAVAIDRAIVQRVLIGDEGEDGTGWSVGASFLAATGPASMTFTAAAVADAVLGGQEVLGAWTFATTDYDVSTSNPIYLSFDVGAKYPADELHVWHYDGSIWTPYSPFDLTYDGTYASFTVTGLSGYAVTPEPGTLALLAVAMLGLIAWARRRRR